MRNPFSTTVETSVEIAATADQVWRVLTDFAAYPQWNPFIVRARGHAAPGTTLSVTISNHGSQLTFTPRVLAADPGRELRWRGRFLLPGVVDGEHCFTLEPLEDGRVRLVQQESFTGLLVPLAGSSLDVAEGFAAMNAALKRRAEAPLRAAAPEAH